MPVADFFKGKHIFITGGSGFLGKLLIEKLLRSCPDVGHIYVLFRSKKGQSIEERWKQITSLPLFDLLKKTNSDALKKIILVKGDVGELNLGLSDLDRNTLIEKVNIIYHTAASVRFDDFLKNTIVWNVRGTREIAKLALELKNISLFVHVSTTFSNCDRLFVEEKLYPPHGDWKEAIKLAEESDDETFTTLTLKYIEPMPNTYTFSKSLGEHAVNDLCGGKIPTVIVRPSVVVNSFEEPVVGWHDNFNGPVGILAAGAKGLLRVMLGRRHVEMDYIPVDFVIKGVLVISETVGKKGVTENVDVYNISQNRTSGLTQGQLIEMGRKLVQNSPYSMVLWYPRFFMTHCWYNFYIQVVLFHMIPAFFFDIGLRLAGLKPVLVKVHRKIYIAITVLMPFMANTFTFIHDKLWDLERQLQEEDSAFRFKLDAFNDEEKYEYFKNSKIGTGLYVLKEKFDYTGKISKSRIRKFWYADITVKTIFFSWLFWFLVMKHDLLRVVLNGVENYLNSL